jgi:hypothetical protein
MEASGANRVVGEAGSVAAVAGEGVAAFASADIGGGVVVAPVMGMTTCRVVCDLVL